ncbi:efflux RND transporter permease subunit [bacterium]|nr:efflux RND transporter permease subunit [bacterium]
MKNVLRLFIKYPLLGNVILVTLLVFGWVGFKSLKTTFFPIVPSRIIMISTFYPGASPEEIEEAIVLKIEDNLKGVTGIERVTSVSSENACRITVTVLTGYDINIVLQDVKDAVNQVSSFPVGMERLTIYRQEARNFAIDFVLAGEASLAELKKEARRVERDLLSKDGISKVSLSGFPDEEIEIALREKDLRAYELTFNEVLNAVRNANVKMTGGKIKGLREEMLIRADVKAYYAEELANHLLKSTPEGVLIRLKDVADLSDRWSENPNRVYHNGKRAVLVTVQNTNQEDLFQVTRIVKAYLKTFNESHTDIQTYIVRDGSEVIQERIDILSSNGLLGLVLVLLFLSLSLNPRMAFWVAISIPISFAGMTMLGPFYGLTINVMSLLGMILVLGILVDDGIVIAENIYQHHERGEKPIPAAVNGTLEVLPSVFSSILTTVVIFLTFFFLEGGLGDRSRDLAFVVIASLMISLLEATFILPAHIAHSKALCRQTNRKGRFERRAEEVLFAFRDRVYAPVLRWSQRYPLAALAIPVGIYIITLGAMQGGIIKTTFFPIIERRNVDIVLEMPAGTPDAITDSLMATIENHVWEVNDRFRGTHHGRDLVTAISRRIGPATHQGNLSVTLIGSQYRDWDAMEATNRIRDQVGSVPGAEKLEFGGSGFWGKPISIALASNDLDQLREAKEDLKAEFRKLDKLKDVVDDDPPGLREIRIQLKERAFALGLTTADVVSQVRSGFFGAEAQRLLRGIDEVKIWVRYDEEDRRSMMNLGDMRIHGPGSRTFPLREIATFSIERGVMTVNHIDAQRVVQVEADITNPKESVPDILMDIQRDILPEIKQKYPDIQFLMEGQSRENAKTMNAIRRVVPPILIMMFLIIVLTFRSFLQASLVFLMVPFSIVGVLWGHFIQGYIVSMLSWFGAIALAGIVVNDSLVLVSTFNRKIKDGRPFHEALFETGISRFRPVLLTSLTTIAGLGPLVFLRSHQAQFLSPMAISVAYGLAFGTLLTLVMLPALLTVTNWIRIQLFWIFTKKRLTPEMVEPALREERFVREQSGPCTEETTDV